MNYIMSHNSSNIKCYDQPYAYSHVTTQSEFVAACEGTNEVFVGAKSSSSATTFTVGAFGYSVEVFYQSSYSTTYAITTLEARTGTTIPATALKVLTSQPHRILHLLLPLVCKSWWRAAFNHSHCSSTSDCFCEAEKNQEIGCTVRSPIL